MYVMLLLGMMVSALVFGIALVEFSPGRLVQVIQSAALVTIILNGVAMWKQEIRDPRRRPSVEPDPTFRESWDLFCQGTRTRRRLMIVGVGTMAFAMADVLLEPFGGQILSMSVAATTKLTALLALGGLFGFAYASKQIGAGADAYKMAQTGALVGLPAFLFVILAAPTGMQALFLLGNFMIGFGGALFGHGTLTATMQKAPDSQAGLAIGAWGAVQATAVGVGMALSGAIRDVVNVMVGAAEGVWGLASTATGYLAVYIIEIVLLVVTILAILPLVSRMRQRRPIESVTTDETHQSTV